MKKKWSIVILVISIVAVITLYVLYMKPLGSSPDGILVGRWEFETYSGGTFYNATVYEHPCIVLNVSSAGNSKVYMLSQESRELPLTSTSLILSSNSSCRIDWGWLGTRDNYAFLTWNQTHWIADTSNGSGTPELTTIVGYDPSGNWRTLQIKATSTQVEYYIDDQLVATHTHNIPSGEFQFYGELKSAGNPAKLYIASHRD